MWKMLRYYGILSKNGLPPKFGIEIEPATTTAQVHHEG